MTAVIRQIMNILIIGGTRNMGFFLAERVLQAGHRLTLLNRGVSQDTLPASIPRLRCDRTDVQQMRRALAGRTFDVVIDMVLYKGPEAEAIVDILSGHVGHYVFVSTGQVYLVREGLKRPFRENDYAGPVMAAPDPNTYDYEEWLYGVDKRAAEDALAQAFAARGFPYTALRLPMVNSERDAFNRLYGYLLRIKDRGPILIPDAPNYPLRHIYAHDVVEAIMRVIERGPGQGKVYNISQEETLDMRDFLTLLADIMGMEANIITVERAMLEANALLPDCSPFSDLWMSELDNSLSKSELGMEYTPLADYLERIVAHYLKHPPAQPASYRRRNAERSLVAQG